MDPATPTSEQITLWLTNWRQGDQNASERLFAVVYPQLRRIAARFLGNERNDHTLGPSALVYELYVRLIGSETVAFNVTFSLWLHRPCAGYSLTMQGLASRINA